MSVSVANPVRVFRFRLGQRACTGRPTTSCLHSLLEEEANWRERVRPVAEGFRDDARARLAALKGPDALVVAERVRTGVPSLDEIFLWMLRKTLIERSEARRKAPAAKEQARERRQTRSTAHIAAEEARQKRQERLTRWLEMKAQPDFPEDWKGLPPPDHADDSFAYELEHDLSAEEVTDEDEPPAS